MTKNVDKSKMIDNSHIKIADEVVGVIAGLAATEVEGVAGMSGGIVGGIAEILGRKSLAKGVKVQSREKETIIGVYIISEYGTKIPEVAWNVQENVKDAVETMTGLNVIEVNIHIQGVDIDKEIPEEDAKRKKVK